MSLREHIGTAFDSIDFVLDMAMRIVKAVIEMEPEKDEGALDDMPDLLKDIYKSKMTRCEDQLDDNQNSNINGGNSNDIICNGQSNHSTASQVLPVPSTDNDEADTLTVMSDQLSAHDNYMTSMTGSRDLESFKMEVTHPNRCLNRRITYPAIFDGPQYESGKNVLESEASDMDQRCLNISFKKLDNNLTNQHEGEEVPQLTSDLVLALRKIGDTLDKKIDPKMKKSMWQACISSTFNNLKNICPMESVKATFNLSITVVAEYYRL